MEKKNQLRSPNKPLDAQLAPTGAPQVITSSLSLKERGEREMRDGVVRRETGGLPN